MTTADEWENLSGVAPARATLIAALGVCILLSGCTAFDGAAATEPDTFIIGDHFAIHPIIWAIEENHVSLPDGMTLWAPDNLTVPRYAMANGTADIGVINLLNIPYVLRENPDTHVTPYGLSFNNTFFTVYANPEAGIETIPDLAGARIAMTRDSVHAAITMMVLEAEGVNTSNVTIVHRSTALDTVDLLRDGVVDAAVIEVARPTGFTPLFSPKRYLEREYGASIPLGLVLVDSAVRPGAAQQVSTLLTEAIIIGRDGNIPPWSYNGRTDDVPARVAYRMNGTSMVAMDARQRAAVQDIIDHAYEAGMIARHAEITARSAP